MDILRALDAGDLTMLTLLDLSEALKTREWKTRHQTAGMENSGVEIAGV